MPSSTLKDRMLRMWLVFVFLLFANDKKFVRGSDIQFPTEKNFFLSRFTGEEKIKVIKAINNFAFSLYGKLPQTGNLLISPMSLSTAMAMLYYGARNVTQREMSEVLGYDTANLDFDEVHRGFHEVLRSLKNKNAEYTLETANAVLTQKDYPVLASYKSQVEQIYNATIQEVDFNQGEIALKMINAWTAWRTHDKIRELLKEPPGPLTRLFLLNAVYFKGTWKTKFDQRITTPDTFYNNGRVPKTVPMMRLKAKLAFGIDRRLKCSILEMPYNGEEVSMVIMLPQERDGLPELEKIVSAEVLANAASSLRKETVQVTLPRFKLTDDHELNEVLKKMGMKSLFDEEKADLSGISKDKRLYATLVMHKTLLDVTEEGTQAAGVTGVAAGVRIGGPYFAADHPFLVFIRDVRTNMIYFMARVSEL